MKLNKIAYAMLPMTLGLISQGAFADTTTIEVSTWGGATYEINTVVWPTWGKWVEEATEGRVTINVTHDLGSPDVQMDMVADQIADMTFFFHGYQPGRFLLTKLPEIPTFEDFSSEVASAAYWNTYNELFMNKNEHRGLRLIALGVHGPGVVITDEPIERLEDFAGERIRVGGGVMADVANALDISGVALPPTGIYEAASQGVVAGSMMTLGGLVSFRLAEVLPYTLEIPGGFYRGSFAFVMNEEKWSSISEDDRAAIMSVSGEKLSRLFGHVMDEVIDTRGVEFAKENNNTFYELSETELERLKSSLSEIRQDWIEAVQGRHSIDGLEALEYYREQLEKAKSSPSISTSL